MEKRWIKPTFFILILYWGLKSENTMIYYYIDIKMTYISVKGNILYYLYLVYI